MKHQSYIVSTAVLLVSLAASTSVHAADVTLMSWGGAYGQSQVEAYNKPFTAKTGVGVTMVDADDPAVPIKAQVEAGNVTVDIVDLNMSDVVRLCDEGLLEELKHDELPAAPDGTAAVNDFVDGALDSECAVGNIVWSTIYAYRTDKFAGDKPSTMADFFDLEKFPGKRGLRKVAKTTLEMALIADGVPAADIYQVLATPEGLDRAFAKLDTIKSEAVWWEAGAQAPQLLADGEVVMTTAYNGRIFDAQVAEKQPFAIVWDGQILDFDLFAIPRGAPNKDAAWDYIKFATGTQPLADQAKWIAYGPARKSSAAFVGKYRDDKTDMGPHMPTAPENMKTAVTNDFEFWADYGSEISQRFNTWLLQ